jgi:hypothetical protein
MSGKEEGLNNWELGIRNQELGEGYELGIRNQESGIGGQGI